MATATLSATPRTDRGTGVARKLRQIGQVPAVIYGHGREPQSLALNTREVDRLLENAAAISYTVGNARESQRHAHGDLLARDEFLKVEMQHVAFDRMPLDLAD